MADFEVYGKIVPVQADISALQKSVQSYFDKNPIVINTTFGTSGSGTNASFSVKDIQNITKAEVTQANRIAAINSAASRQEAAAARSAAAVHAKNTAAIKEENAARKQANDIQKETNAASKREIQAQTQLTNLQTRSLRYYNKIKDNSKLTNEQAQAWKDYMSALQSGKMTPEEAANGFAKLQKEMVASGIEVESFGQKMKNLFTRHWDLAVIMTAVHLLKQAIREVIENVVELDKELTQFQIVSGASDSEMSAFAESALQAAGDVSAAVTDIVNAATVYKRLGYSTEEALDFSKLTTMLSRVGNVDISEAESGVTAMIKAFDLTSTDLQLALDQMVWVGNNFPIASGEISTAMQNSAAALAVGGNSIEQSMALLTAANTTVQNAAKASTGMRTITARIRNTSAELDDLGRNLPPYTVMYIDNVA